MQLSFNRKRFYVDKNVLSVAKNSNNTNDPRGLTIMHSKIVKEYGKLEQQEVLGTYPYQT